MMMQTTPAPSPPDLRLQTLTVLLDLASLVRDAGPALSKSLAELVAREQSISAREAAVTEREERIRQALQAMP
jgi:hypothetical protein